MRDINGGRYPSIIFHTDSFRCVARTPDTCRVDRLHTVLQVTSGHLDDATSVVRRLQPCSGVFNGSIVRDNTNICSFLHFLIFEKWANLPIPLNFAA